MNTKKHVTIVYTLIALLTISLTGCIKPTDDINFSEPVPYKQDENARSNDVNPNPGSTASEDNGRHEGYRGFSKRTNGIMITTTICVYDIRIITTRSL